MLTKSTSKGVIKDVTIVVVGVLVIWVGLQVVFGIMPFFVVASGSMIPELQVNDIIIVQGNCLDLWKFIDSQGCIKLNWYASFEDIEKEDVIVFDRPSDHNRVIVHRVVSISDDSKTIRTQGDANRASIPGTDFPITEEEYIGKVVHKLPQIGIIPKLLGPPVNYIIIVIVIGVMVIKQVSKKKKDKNDKLSDVFNSENHPDTDDEELSNIDKMEKDTEYLEHTEKSETLEDKKDDNQDKASKTDDNSEKDKKE